ncbi:hypothetical protein FZ103_04950 [Streptomonospora sp. PA3]|uniref:SPW repeat protein n=1 Tax=Streptomonospora sp. PA3 TaxID=2607326 RepID=UPI0012DE7B4E|nr:SPW repeat protein [Streptomonospora sp. PA3]MUL40533.1 hypothetical protein [Streptomonospora sp. PA3]
MVEQANSTIEQHPDIVALRARSEAALANPAVQAAEALGLLTGLYIAVSPWVVGFTANGPLMISNLIAGLGFTFLLVGFGSAFERTHGMSWAAVGIGVWTIIAPWLVAGPTAAVAPIISNVVAGGVAVLLALTIAGMGMAKAGASNSGRRR